MTILGISGPRDAWACALESAKGLADGGGIVGYGVAELIGPQGRAKLLVPFANLITDAGDLYYATKAVVSISPANGTAPTAVTGMKLGTSTTAAAKASTGGALVAYITGSNAVFDTTGGPYPTVVNLGAGLGVNAVYKTTWAAGTATNATINEVVIVNDAGTNATTSVANTISRAVLSSTVNKTASDTLAITWNHKFLGA